MESDDRDSELILSIDAGGTKTEVCIARRGQDGIRKVIGRAFGGPGNVTSTGIKSLLLELETTIPEAACDAGINSCDFDYGIVGLAGGGDRQQCVAVQQWLVNGLCRSARVVSDAEMVLLLADALSPSGHAPIGLLVGTGSVVFYRVPGAAEDLHRAGGWGPIIGDDGSGYWIGREAVRRVLRASDSGNDVTAFTEGVFSAMNAESPRELIAKVSEADDTTKAIAALAATVADLSKRGDANARAILLDAATHVDSLLDTAVSHIVRQSGDPAKITVACAGRVMTTESAFSDHLKERMRTAGIADVYFIDNPAEAAIQLAPGV